MLFLKLFIVDKVDRWIVFHIITQSPINRTQRTSDAISFARSAVLAQKDTTLSPRELERPSYSVASMLVTACDASGGW